MEKSRQERLVTKVLRRLSLIEIFVHDQEVPLMETEVETGSVTLETPLVTRMIKRQPEVILVDRGNLKHKQ